MKYKELIKRFEKYAEEEVSMVISLGAVIFYPVSDGDTEIIALESEKEDPFKAHEVQL